MRLGKQTDDGPPRPIKVSLRSSETALQLQFSGRRLKDDHATKRVFISPDRSWEEREVRKRLMKEVKEKMRSDPNKYHYISGTSVVSCDRKQNESLPAAPIPCESDSDTAFTTVKNTCSITYNYKTGLDFAKAMRFEKENQWIMMYFDVPH